jgi:hypothetical protein
MKYPKQKRGDVTVYTYKHGGKHRSYRPTLRIFMSEKKPTEQARLHFGIAQQHSRLAHQISAKENNDVGMQKSHMAISLYEIAEGMSELATGIRATYILLDEVKKLLEQRRS